MKAYTELLKDPRWQKKKLEIMQRDNFTCRHCGSTTKTLNVHHIKYINGRMPWEYDNDDLITLCEDCHHEEHGETKPMIGEVYEMEHSDYVDTLVCYSYNYKKGKVYLFGYDNGASENSIYFICENMDKFIHTYERRCKFWDLLYTNLPFEQNILLRMMEYIYNGNWNRRDFNYYILDFPYPDEMVLDYARHKLDDILANNEILNCKLRDLIC